MLEAVAYEVVWNGTRAFNGGLLMASAEKEQPVAKNGGNGETVTKGVDGWGFETLDEGRKAGYKTRDEARNARKEWIAGEADREAARVQAEMDAQAKAREEAAAKALMPEPENVPRTVTGRRKKMFLTADEIIRVVELRKTGLSFQRIEAEMGWPDFHGCKARRIVQELE